MSIEVASNARAVRQVRRIAVCGAGVAGLTLAVRLARLGFEVTVFEARDEAAIETDGVFLTLAPNGMNGLRCIDLHKEVAASGIATTAIEILDERGRRLALVDQSDHETAFGAHSITIRRGRLAKLLLMRARAEGVTVRLGQRVVAVSETSSGLAIETGDGNEMRFNLLAASVAQQEDAITAFIASHNQDPKPFRWTKSADDIFQSISRFCQRTLVTHATS